MTVWSAVHVAPASETLAGRPEQGLGDDLRENEHRVSPAGGVPHEAHEGLTLSLRKIREESNHLIEIGGHPKWSEIFLDCRNSRGFCNNSTPRGGTETAAPPAKASDAAVSLSGCSPFSASYPCPGVFRWPEDPVHREVSLVHRRCSSSFAAAVGGLLVLALGCTPAFAAEPEGVPAAAATATADAGRDRAKVYRLDPVTEKLFPVTAREIRPGHVYGRYDAGLGRWIWSKADATGRLRYAMGEGSTQPARMFDLRGSDAERQRALEKRAPELARLLAIQGARPMLRLDGKGQWGLGPTPHVSSVFDAATGERWEWHGDEPSRVVHSGGSRWRVVDGWYAPGF